MIELIPEELISNQEFYRKVLITRLTGLIRILYNKIFETLFTTFTTSPLNEIHLIQKVNYKWRKLPEDYEQ